MKDYKVTFTAIEKEERFVKANSEAEAIMIIQDETPNFPIKNVRAKEVKFPTIEDYYFMKEIAWFLATVSLVLFLLLLFGGFY